MLSLSKLAPAKVGLKEESGFLGIWRTEVFNRPDTDTRHKAKERLSRLEWQARKEPVDKKQGPLFLTVVDRATPVSRMDRPGQDHTHRGQCECGTVLHGSRVFGYRLTTLFLWSRLVEPWMPAVGKSCAPRSHGEPCLLPGEVPSSLPSIAIGHVW